MKRTTDEEPHKKKAKAADKAVDKAADKAVDKPSAKAGTTKVYACDAAETGFDYLIFSESNALTQSVRAALKGNPKFRTELQPALKKAYYGTGAHVVGVRLHAGSSASASSDKQDQGDAAVTACETLRQVLEARPEIRCIEHERLLALVKTLYAQMRDLEQAPHQQTVPYFGLDDVVVLNDAVALFINDDKLFAIRNGDGGATGAPTATIDVTRAIGRDGAFYPPELSDGRNKTASLPYTVDARCAYYSFGMLVAYCATLNPALLANGGKESGRQRLKLKRDVLGPIEGTKLYWFIVRCCASDAARRCMLYV
jgi:hypothetical protein